MTFEYMKRDGNRAIMAALNHTRKFSFYSSDSEFWLGYALGIIHTADVWMYADSWIAEGARNEINFLYRRAHRGW